MYFYIHTTAMFFTLPIYPYLSTSPKLPSFLPKRFFSLFSSLSSSLPSCRSAPPHCSRWHSPVPVDDGVEREAVAPRGGEVVDAYARVAFGGPLRPPQQRVLGVDGVVALDDVRYLEHRTTTTSANQAHVVSESASQRPWRERPARHGYCVVNKRNGRCRHFN